MAGASSPRRRGSRNLNEPRFSSALPGRHPREGGDPETSMNRASARLCRDVRCSAMWEREVAAGEGLSCPLFPPAVQLAMTAKFVTAPPATTTLGILDGGRATRLGRREKARPARADNGRD